MKQLFCIVVIIAVVGLVGCSKQQPAPAHEPEAVPTQTEPISTEDFESGEADGAVDEQGEAPAEGDQSTGQ